MSLSTTFRKPVLLLLLLGVFSVRAVAQPVITSLSALSGASGTSITISGTGFNATAGNNVVWFGSTAGTVTAASATSLTVTVPNGGLAGPVTVLNSALGQVGTSNQVFTPTFDNTGYTSYINFARHTDITWTSPSIFGHTGLRMADLNNDGKNDLIMSSAWTANVSVYINTSTGGTISYASPVNFPYFGEIEIADMNGDGKLDIVDGYGSIYVYLNAYSGGAFTSSSMTLQGPFSTGCGTIALGDIDGDGKVDVVSTNNASEGYSFDSTIKILRNTTSGSTLSFAAAVVLNLGNKVARPTIADVDGDGKKDIIFQIGSSVPSNISVLRNVSSVGSINSSSFSSAVVVDTIPEFITDIKVADFNGDGKPDLAATSYDFFGSVTVLQNNCTPGTISGSSFTSSTAFSETMGSNTPVWMQIADFDGNGKPDIAIGYLISSTDTNKYYVATLRNSSTSSGISFGNKTVFKTKSTNTDAFIAADMDGDGRPDLTAVDNAYISTLINIPSTYMASITGTAKVCVGGITGLADSTPDGTWSSSNTSVANVTSGGNVVGVGPGTVTISYTYGSYIATKTATVNPVPNAITGATNICPGSTITLANSTPGGTWTSGTPSWATVGSASGIVTGVANGMPLIRYILPSGCLVSAFVTVNNTPPSAGSISGPSTFGIGASATLSSTVTGGTWSASNSNVTVGSATGLVTGVADGTTTISYTVSNSCGTAVATKIVTVDAGITGVLSISSGGTTTLSATEPGGSWSTGCTDIATVSPGGVVTGVSSGFATISYTTSSGYSTVVVTVTSTTTAITWPSVFNWVCKNTGWVVGHPVSGGVWSTSDTSIGVYSGGSVFGVSPGTITISYAYGSGCTSTKAVTVEPAPTQGVISGAHSLLAGETMTLSTSGSGGTWSSTNSNISMTTTGAATGVSVGTAIISYTSTTAHCGTLAATVAVPVSAGGCAYWSNVGMSGFTNGFAPAPRLAIDNSGTPYVTYPDNPISGKLTVAKYNGSAWETIGTDLSAGITTVSSSPIAIDGSNNIYVAYCDNHDSFKANVKKFDGTSWVYVGTPLFSAGMVQNLCLKLDPSGVPYVAYIDTPNGKKVTVMKFNGTDWSPVGVVGFSSANVTEMDMTISVGGIPYVAFRDAANGNKATVMKFNGTFWEFVGGAGISAGGAYGNSLATDSTGIPYLLYRDDANSDKATVVKYNGSVWELIGGAPVSTGSAGSCMIAMRNDGTPYVVYMDGSVEIKATVKKFTGTGWQVVGSAGFTGYWALSPVIAMTNTGVPYVAFCDYGNNTKASVMKLVGTEVNITGTLTVCPGGNVTLSSSSSGGTWSSGSVGVATIGSLTGIVHGVTGGTATISYTLASGCVTTAIVTVNAATSAGSITGTASTCVGGTSSLGDAVAGGTWSTGDTAVATIGSTGIVSGVAPGTTTVSYTVANSCGTAVATKVFTVNTTASAGTITGLSSVLTGAAITLSNTVGGGTWSASNGNATINSSGVVTGVTAGTVMISYTVSNSCGTAVATKIVAVNDEPLTISGSLTVCTGATTALSANFGGGTWSSGDASVASVSSTGVVTGVSAGVVAIVYTTATSSASVSVTVTAAPSMTGTVTLCPGATTTISGGSTGGTWTGGSTVVATVGSTGVVTGIAAGTTNITYSTGAACNATITVTVNSAPASITGTLKACPGTSTTLSSMTAGGAWTSSDPTIATADATTGVITGIAAGTITVTYSAGAGCYRTATVTVNPTPAPIGGALVICTGGTTSLTDITPGLSWSSSNTAVATIASNGVVSGAGAGNATITYTAASSNCITTAVVTVNGVPATIGGPATGCVGSNITLTNSVPGGVWSSNNTAVATVDPSTGVVTGVATGMTTITYATGTGCYITKAISINNSPTVTGYPTVCVGLTTTLSGGSSGTWTSSTPSVATIATSGGYVTGVSSGTSTMTFTSTTTTCPATYMVTVIPVPSAITGATVGCQGSSVMLSNSTPGGSWTSNNTAIASVGSSTGIVTAVGSGGTATISYSFGNCRVTAPFSPKPVPAAFGGSTSVCTPLTTTLTCTTGGGTWSSSDASVATVGSAISVGNGVVTGVAAGNANITYTISATGCARSAAITVNTGLNPGTITSSGGFTLHTVSAPTSVTLSSTGAPGGTWTSSNTAVATVNAATGVVTAVAAGTTTITYAVTASCTNITTRTVTVTAGKAIGSVQSSVGSVQLYPNPTTGAFTLVSEEAGILNVYGIDGREITRYDITAGLNPLSLPRELASGIYMCKYTNENGSTTVVRLVYER